MPLIFCKYCIMFHFIKEETGTSKELNHLRRSHCKEVAKSESAPRFEAKDPTSFFQNTAS